jgi:hypothetical protein
MIPAWGDPRVPTPLHPRPYAIIAPLDLSFKRHTLSTSVLRLAKAAARSAT